MLYKRHLKDKAAKAKANQIDTLSARIKSLEAELEDEQARRISLEGPKCDPSAGAHGGETTFCSLRGFERTLSRHSETSFRMQCMRVLPNQC